MQIEFKPEFPLKLRFLFFCSHCIDVFFCWGHKKYINAMRAKER